ncbi:MAG TPA: uroporphyrinogen-III synthase [Steroidobacteraceae bacterium]|nr:uroporphyrinogen-III synthase [Steroidobacteraceae bacterium]
MNAAVVVTRDESADGPLSRELRALGLEVLGWPVLSIGAAGSGAALAQALSRLDQFEWLVFASQHAVAEVVRRVPVPPAYLNIAAVGARTAQALIAAGWSVTAVPEEQTAEALVALLAPRLTPGMTVLFAAGSRSLPTLREGLTEAGAIVTQVEAYATLPGTLDIRTCRQRIARGDIGAVTFTSPSAVEELDRALGPTAFNQLLDGAAAITLGTTTGRFLAARGFASVLAIPATLHGMAHTTLRFIQTRA